MIAMLKMEWEIVVPAKIAYRCDGIWNAEERVDSEWIVSERHVYGSWARIKRTQRKHFECLGFQYSPRQREEKRRRQR
jgi:hypothetical protein